MNSEEKAEFRKKKTRRAGKRHRKLRNPNQEQAITISKEQSTREGFRKRGQRGGRKKKQNEISNQQSVKLHQFFKSNQNYKSSKLDQLTLRQLKSYLM